MELSNKKKIGFWAGDSNNFLFLKQIIEDLSRNFDVESHDYNGDDKLLEEQLGCCNLAWLEWGNGPVIAASYFKLVNIPIICRIHRYEAYHEPSLSAIHWDGINKIIVVAEFVKKLLIEKFPELENKISVIPNGVNLNQFSLSKTRDKYSIAFVGRFHPDKDPLFALQCFYNLYQKDKRYKIYFAGNMCSPVISQKFYYLVGEWGLGKNVFYDGYVSDINNWLEGKSHIICSSVIESQNIAVMEAMAKGIKPAIYNFYGAKGIYPEEFIFNTPDGFTDLVLKDDYQPEKYRAFVEKKYSFTEQMKNIHKIIYELIGT